ncbi:response regulator transcription factor [Marinibactrum halimedae]|uniref:DNA-binding response regulator n=1 Tax=Marinibactrum halimedae TaxID=1444977 RepID=A0AA37WRE0_9GAMM|nr:response regulator transcription factor [Marinibactrum halimedae]MCD9459994.1 response regulator transcription factor [Marinibactrum halimedae]GLS28237.1 DNA-binding response regulator [Marinibactrum halimedae]
MEFHSHRILLIDDDVTLCDGLSQLLNNEGYFVESFHYAKPALEVCKIKPYHLIIIDLMISDMDGYSFLQELRRTDQTPVIVLTAKGEESDRIHGLEYGADDYIAKPFNSRELLLRIKAILKRTAPDILINQNSAFGKFSLDAHHHSITYRNTLLELTGAEYTILKSLILAQGNVISRELLTEQALGRKLTPFDRALDTHISNLRAKLAHDACDKPVIRSKRGSGYYLVEAAAN